jgi:hypothetical protein
MRSRDYFDIQNLDAQCRCYEILAKRHAGWRYARWFQLIGASFNIATGAFLLYVAQARASSAAAWDQQAVLLYPVSIAILTTGAVLCSLALSKWRGDPVIALLLGLSGRTDSRLHSNEQGGAANVPQQ